MCEGVFPLTCDFPHAGGEGKAKSVAFGFEDKWIKISSLREGKKKAPFGAKSNSEDWIAQNGASRRASSR